ncbi:MAG TPA: hypothetical protein VJ739_12145 [Gemmataceae bacterium]|nr:hypothetical protein [Gemmataceae bacterium]
MAWLPMYLDRPDADLLLSWLNEDEEIAFIVLAGRKTRPTEQLERLRASGQSFTFYAISGMAQLVEVKNRWRAVQRLDALPDGKYTLWHVPGGPLPLLAGDRRPRSRRQAGRGFTLAQALGHEDGTVPDPWAGWIERQPGADPSQPYFGAGHAAIIDLEVRTREVLETYLEEDLLTVRREIHDPRMIGLSDFSWIGNHYRIIGRPALAVTERWWGRLRRRVRRVATRVTRSGPLRGPHAEVYAFPAALDAIQGGMGRSVN